MPDNSPSVAPRHPLLPPAFTPQDEERLRGCLRHFLKRGSLLRDRPGQQELYDWARLHQTELGAAVGLLDLRLAWEHEARLVQAIPQGTALLRHLARDETLVLLAMWYDYDTAQREDGVDPLSFSLSVAALLASLDAKFAGLTAPSRTRLGEILRLAERYQWLTVQERAPFEESTIAVLPTLRHVLPFPSIDEWHRLHRAHVESLRQLPADSVPITDEPED